MQQRKVKRGTLFFAKKSLHSSSFPLFCLFSLLLTNADWNFDFSSFSFSSSFCQASTPKQKSRQNSSIVVALFTFLQSPCWFSTLLLLLSRTKCVPPPPRKKKVKFELTTFFLPRDLFGEWKDHTYFWFRAHRSAKLNAEFLGGTQSRRKKSDKTLGGFCGQRR